MEYLSLQDIPRHYNPLHSHSMASSQYTERPMGSLAANPHSRSSPPIQPNERNERGYADKLPSFSEFLHTSGADHTPPHTPSRRQGSHDESPHAARPRFEDVAWKDAGHRRIDTLGDIYAHTSRGHVAETLPQDHRRMSNAVDLSLTRRNSPAYAPESVQQHKPSYSYPPPQASAPYNAHIRHYSSPAPPQQSLHRNSPTYPGLAAPGAYPPPAHNASVIVHRPNYYQDHHAPAQAYTYGPPYSAAVHPGYENGYGEVRFQQHVGADPNNFNRKRRGNLPKEATNVLKNWFASHRAQPYPTEDQKVDLCQITGLTMNQVSNWFINARRRAPLKEQREREANGGQAAEQR